jgi:hypothetical protein
MTTAQFLQEYIQREYLDILHSFTPTSEPFSLADALAVQTPNSDTISNTLNLHNFVTMTGLIKVISNNFVRIGQKFTKSQWLHIFEHIFQYFSTDTTDETKIVQFSLAVSVSRFPEISALVYFPSILGMTARTPMQPLPVLVDGLLRCQSSREAFSKQSNITGYVFHSSCYCCR